MPATSQICLVLAAAVVLAAGGGLSALRLKWERAWLVWGPRLCLVTGVLLMAAALLCHAMTRRDWIPVTDNFDALLWLSLLLSLFVLYIQRRHGRLGGVDRIIMPLVIVLLAAAAYFGTHAYRQYQPMTHDVWAWTRRLTVYAATAAFAVSAAGGAMYVLISRRLRRKTPISTKLASLERMERLMTLTVRCGFVLLTISLATGLAGASNQPRQISPAIWAFSIGAWLAYALVLHAPLNPLFRGRRAALLSILGFVLMMGAVTAVQLAGGRH